jgi:hypothetical protein
MPTPRRPRDPRTLSRPTFADRPGPAPSPYQCADPLPANGKLPGRRRCHLARPHHRWRSGDAVRDATGAIYHALRRGTPIPGQQPRMRQLAPGTWNQALADVPGASPRWQGDGPSYPVVEIAICPDVVWLAAHSLRARAAPATAPRCDTPAAAPRRNASHPMADQRAQPPKALPLKLRHPRSAACRRLRSDGTGVRHEAPRNRVEVEDLRRRAVAAAW